MSGKSKVYTWAVLLALAVEEERVVDALHIVVHHSCNGFPLLFSSLLVGRSSIFTARFDLQSLMVPLLSVLLLFFLLFLMVEGRTHFHVGSRVLSGKGYDLPCTTIFLLSASC